MNQPERPEVKYLARRCAFLKQDVWAILVQQEDGRWRIVNCLDKEKRCFQQPCVFTMDGGHWPFRPNGTVAGATISGL